MYRPTLYVEQLGFLKKEFIKDIVKCQIIFVGLILQEFSFLVYYIVLYVVGVAPKMGNKLNDWWVIGFLI